MDNMSGAKELYDINIRLNDPVEIGGRKYDINETILSFESAEIAQLAENKTRTIITGGYQNRFLLDWEIEKQCSFAISRGVLSPLSWAVLSNSKLKEEQMKSVSFKESLDVIEDVDKEEWFVDLKFIPNTYNQKFGLQYNPENQAMPMGRKPWLPLKPQPPQRDKFIFCYDEETGQRIMNFDILGNRIIFKADHKRVVVDYTFDYDDKIREISVGNRLFNGFLNLTGKMSVKDYFSGEVKTAILTIPKLKLDSNLALKLGEGYDNPMVTDFFFTGYPGEGRRPEDETVCMITFLDTELTGDYL